MISAPIKLYRSEVERVLDFIHCDLTWDELSPRNRRRVVILVLRNRIDLTSHAFADLLTQGSPMADAFHIIEDLTATNSRVRLSS